MRRNAVRMPTWLAAVARPSSPSYSAVRFQVGSARRSTMPDRKGATLLEDLPEEIIDNILVRLPSKDVGRCRAVSTSWRTATSTPRFMLEHHRRQPSLPIVNGRGQPEGLVVFQDTGAGASNQQLWPFLPGVKNRLSSTLCAVCDGLIIVYQGYRSYRAMPRGVMTYRYCICNPVTRKHALLPLPQAGKPFNKSVIIIGFYRHNPTGEYRVLLVSWSKQSSTSSLYVLTVGSDEPRQVSVRTPIVSSPSVEQKLLKELCDSVYCPPAVHHCGSLHWCPYGASDITEGGGDIIVFDTEAESFRWMRCPTQSCRHTRLFNMNGTLALWSSLSPSLATMDLWVVQDYEAEIWASKYRIDLSMVEASRQLYLTSFEKKKRGPPDSMVHRFNDMAVFNERELLIRVNGNHVLRCDIDGKFLGFVNLGKSQYCVWLTPHRLQESIVPIPYHEMQEEDEDSPFYKGHL